MYLKISHFIINHGILYDPEHVIAASFHLEAQIKNEQQAPQHCTREQIMDVRGPLLLKSKPSFFYVAMGKFDSKNQKKISQEMSQIASESI